MLYDQTRGKAGQVQCKAGQAKSHSRVHCVGIGGSKCSSDLQDCQEQQIVSVCGPLSLTCKILAGKCTRKPSAAIARSYGEGRHPCARFLGEVASSSQGSKGESFLKAQIGAAARPFDLSKECSKNFLKADTECNKPLTTALYSYCHGMKIPDPVASS